MTPRHRIPTIFNLSMVDVLCCALGCVILLWLVNMREVKERAEAVSRTSDDLQRARIALAQKTEEADDVRKLLGAASKDLDDTRSERDRLRARLAELDKALAALGVEKADVESRLAKKSKEQQDLAKELTAARLRVDTLETQVKDKDKLARDTAKELDALSDRLRDAEVRGKQLKTLSETIPTLKDKISVAEGRALALEKELAERKKDLVGAGRTLLDLEKANSKLLQEMATRSKDLTEADRRITTLLDEKRSLIDQASRARAAAENRFAGITLTGRRVLFLVDMSGSMDLVDDKTPATDKWLGVRETLAKIMRSLPDLDRFQVILFSDKVSFVLGSDDQWLDYDPKASPDRAFKALEAVKPKGGTNMYQAFETAFRFRAQGLDTIYLLSDGLPNMGAGLTTEVSRNLKEFERADILAKHVRKTLAADWNRALTGKPRVRINAVGFFYESPDVGAFLWALARENDGSFVGMSKP